MTPTVLLTLGRLPKALALARALHAAGCRVVIAEPFRWHVCKPSLSVAANYRVPAPNDGTEAYLAALLDIISRENIDLVVPVSEEALHVAGLHDRLPARVRLLCPDAEVLEALHDKLLFAQRAAQLSLSVPTTFSAHTAEAAELASSSAYVTKPALGCSGIGLGFHESGTTPPKGIDNLLVQQQVTGREISTLSFLSEGQVITTVIYEGLVFAGTVAVCFERVIEMQAVETWVRTFCEGLNYSGFIAFDFIVDEHDTPWGIECNPRVTSGVHFLDEFGLGQALSSPESPTYIALREDTRKCQWAYSTLTEAYASILKPSEFWRCLRHMLSACDVVWSLRDPLPFLLMTPMSWEILWPAMTSNLSLGEATQRDIARFEPASRITTLQAPKIVSAVGGESGS